MIDFLEDVRGIIGPNSGQEFSNPIALTDYGVPPMRTERFGPVRDARYGTREDRGRVATS